MFIFAVEMLVLLFICDNQYVDKLLTTNTMMKKINLMLVRSL